MKNKILIDAISLLSPSTGIGRYTFEISKIIKEDKNFDTTFFYGYYSDSLLIPEKKTKSKYLKSLLSKNEYLKKIIRWISFNLTRFNSKKFDLYFQPNFIVNNNIKAKKVITAVHDFSFFKYKKFHPKERVEYFEKYFLKNIKKSDHIVCFSEFTKNEIINILDISENKISVLYHGVQKEIFYKKAQVNTKLDLPEKFILSVGSIEPRKNLITLLTAYDKLDNKIKKEYKLVLVGFKGWENKEIMEIISKNNIVYLGYISDEELSNVYNLATCFVFPSFYEGFGLPLLEAMACGTPVIASNRSCIPEVCSNAALHFNPEDFIELKDKIELLLADNELQNKLIFSGFERVKNFSWENSAQAHIDIFKKLLNKV